MPEEQPAQHEVPTVQQQIANNGYAVAALIVGIVAFFTGFIPIWGLFSGLTAVVLGMLALRKPTGRGLAVTGVVTGALAALTGLLVTAAFITSLTSNAAVRIQEQQKELHSRELINAKKNFSKGETAIFDSLEVKVVSIDRNYTLENDTRNREGAEYIRVNLTVKNIGKNNKYEYIDRSTFRVRSNGALKSAVYEQKSTPINPSNDIAPNASVTESYVYSIKQDSTDLKLEYQTMTRYGQGNGKPFTYSLAL
jgi:hypothetical protein